MIQITRAIYRYADLDPRTIGVTKPFETSGDALFHLIDEVFTRDSDFRVVEFAEDRVKFRSNRGDEWYEYTLTGSFRELLPIFRAILIYMCMHPTTIRLSSPELPRFVEMIGVHGDRLGRLCVTGCRLRLIGVPTMSFLQAIPIAMFAGGIEDHGALIGEMVAGRHRAADLFAAAQLSSECGCSFDEALILTR